MICKIEGYNLLPPGSRVIPVADHVLLLVPGMDPIKLTLDVGRVPTLVRFEKGEDGKIHMTRCEHAEPRVEKFEE